MYSRLTCRHLSPPVVTVRKRQRQDDMSPLSGSAVRVRVPVTAPPRPYNPASVFTLYDRVLQTTSEMSSRGEIADSATSCPYSPPPPPPPTGNEVGRQEIQPSSRIISDSARTQRMDSTSCPNSASFAPAPGPPPLPSPVSSDVAKGGLSAVCGSPGIARVVRPEGATVRDGPDIDESTVLGR